MMQRSESEQKREFAAMDQSEAIEVPAHVQQKLVVPLSQQRVAELGSFQYDLRAVVHHSSTSENAASGHYYTDVRTMGTTSISDTWVRFDDDKPVALLPASVVAEAQSQRTAYILFFERRAAGGRR